MSSISNDAIQQLAAKAQVLGLQKQVALSQATRTLLQQADQQRRLLSADELQGLCSDSGVEPEPLQALQQRAHELVDQARHQLLQAQPELVQAGGALYPASRAEACWRDCFHFLRVCCYAVATAKPQFNDSEGMEALGELYAALGVPVKGLLLALSSLHRLTCAAYARQAPEADVQLMHQAFNELQNKINSCVVTSC